MGPKAAREVDDMRTECRRRLSGERASGSASGRAPSSTVELMTNLANGVLPPVEEFRKLLRKAVEHHKKLKNIVPVSVAKSIHIVGDTHGQFRDLMGIFERLGFPSAENPYLFNGDFVDRGSMGVEIVIAILAWQQKAPGSVFINRGNQFVFPAGRNGPRVRIF
jgi:serine/threonine-protein phosphatase 5